MEGIGMVTGEPVVQQVRKLWQYFATLSACFLALGVGSVLSWTSPVLPELMDPDGWLRMNTNQASWVGGLMSIGAIIGAVPAGKLTDKIGRKKTIIATALPFLAGWVMICFSSHVYVLYVARIFGGMGIGLTCVVVPMYIGEIAHPSIRGILGSIFQLGVSSGVLFGFVVGSYVPYLWFAIICALIEVAFFCTFFFMPESPQWLMSQGRKSDASKALAVFRGPDYDVNEELAAMQKSAEDAASRKTSIADLVNTRGARIGLLTALGLLACQQFSGVNAVILYASTIFKAAGSSVNDSVSSIIVAFVQASISCVASLIVDRVGRRTLLISSSSVLAVCLFFLGLYFKENLTSVSWLPLLSLVLFMLAFSLGYGPVPWMMVGELFPPETKGNASTLAVMVNWSCSFIVTKFFPNLVKAVGEGITFWIFTGIMILATVFGYLVVPETKGRSLQQIQDELNGKTKNGVV